ncbi:hypothetical protein N7451_004628 [Penicillium sp. IBT 35674x]|nr:hypothetical protein N7451_004628 [Penicillium sp. IBT 35674x]
MVEVLASPGVARPWGPQEVVHSPRFITEGCSFNGVKYLSFDHLANYWDSVDADSHSTNQQHSPPLKRLRTSSDSENMSHCLPMDRPHFKGFHCYPPKPHSLHQPTLLSNVIVSPAMETTCSSDGSVYDELPYGYFNQPSHPFTTDPYTGMVDTVPMSDFDWTAKNMSFVFETENTPSLSSSYEFMEMPKDEPPTWDNMPYETQMPLIPISNDKSIGFQPPNSQFQEFPTSWTSWPTNTENNIQPFAENVDQSTTYPEYSTDWKAQVNEPMVQDYKVSQTIAVTPDQQRVIHQKSTQTSTYTLSHTTTTTSLQDQQPRTSLTYITPHPEITNIQQPRHHLTTGANDHQQHPQHPMQAALQQHTPESLSQPDSPIQTQVQSRTPNHLKATLHYSDSRNAFLIDCKRRGLSYKEIKRMGGFKEAESTLRGRFRTLTKSKEQRVRKPKWLERDVNLLVEAVSIFTDKEHYDYEGDEVHSDFPAGILSQAQTQDQSGNGSQNQALPPKISWKKVAHFIWANGGSYQFGNATCKKKWCEIYGVKM